MTDPSTLDARDLLAQSGPLSREQAAAAIDHAAALMASADFIDAARLYQRVIGVDDPALTGAAMLGLGEALHRLDDDAQALRPSGRRRRPCRRTSTPTPPGGTSPPHASVRAICGVP